MFGFVLGKILLSAEEISKDRCAITTFALYTRQEQGTALILNCQVFLLKTTVRIPYISISFITSVFQHKNGYLTL
jgi:hypothetical protein